MASRKEFPMHEAAEKGDLERVKQLIEQGVSVDSRDDNYITPLHKAAAQGRCEVAELLVDNHCDVNIKDRFGETPVMWATYLGQKDVVDLLLQRGAQVNCADDNKYTLILHASRKGWVDVVQRIVESGEADVNAANIDGYTPLMSASESGHEDVAALLIRAGADVNRTNVWKETALHFASESSHTKVVKVLLEKEGLHLNALTEWGETPLHRACHRGSSEVVKQLLTAGAVANIKKALSISIDEENLEFIRLLVQQGAFFDCVDYLEIFHNTTPVFKESVLKDADLCTQSIVNRFHHESLPALEGNPNFAKRLPCIKKFRLNAPQIRDIENFVKCDIEKNAFCNVIKARPIVLSVLCVQTLITYRTSMKRSASPVFIYSNSPLKRYN